MSRGIRIRKSEDLVWRRGTRPCRNWPGGWDGGGGRGGDDHPNYNERLRRYRLALLLAMSSVVMLFVSFTTAYVVRKAGAVWDPAATISSATGSPVAAAAFSAAEHRCAAAEHLHAGDCPADAPRRMLRWRRSPTSPAFASTTIIRCLVVGDDRSGSGLSRRTGLRLASAGTVQPQLRHQHQQLVLLHPHRSACRSPAGRLDRSCSGPAVTSWLRKPPETRSIILDVTAWYWHFMGLLWLYIFGLLYFGR